VLSSNPPPSRAAQLVQKQRTLWTSRAAALYATATKRAIALRLRSRAQLRRYLPTESQHLFALTLGIGVVCGVLAVGFHLAIQLAEHLLIDHALGMPGRSWMVWTILTPTLGGCLAGAALTWIVPGARGSGIPQVKQAFATQGGRIRFRDALGKFVISAFQIGSGASLGREGPTVHICAGATSLLARLTALPPRNMRRLTPVGVAAGIAAAFNAPIAAVTFTIEEIVGTLDHAVLSGVVVAAALAAVIERGILGVHPVIQVDQTYGLDHASSLPLYALVGLAAGVVSVVFTDALLGVRRWFRSLRKIPTWAQPGLGGLVTGVLAVLVFSWLGTTGVTGGGYVTLGQALSGGLALRALLALCAVKVIATVASYSSGGAGGIFAPSLFIGAMLGGAIGYIDVLGLGHESRQLGAFALVGMGAVFAGVIRAPITSVLIIFEMTGGYGLVLPLMLANATSYVLARRARPVPIYQALLEQDGIHLPHTTRTPSALEQLQVVDAMTSDVVYVTSDASVAEARTLVAGKSFTLLPVIGADASVTGVLSVGQLSQADPAASIATLIESVQLINKEEPLLRALVRMNDLGVRQLVVINGGSRLVGMLAMSDVARAHARALRSPEAQPPAPRAQSTPNLDARALMLPALSVPEATKLSELLDRMSGDPIAAFVVQRSNSRVMAILPEQLAEFGRDPELARMLIAADVARPVTIVAPNTTVTELVSQLQTSRDQAAVVIDSHGSSIGVVRRSTLAEAILDWYAAALPLAS
jgi:CIC family chloride channel protein